MMAYRVSGVAALLLLAFPSENVAYRAMRAQSVQRVEQAAPGDAVPYDFAGAARVKETVPLDGDAEAKDDFVRTCTVSTTVKGSEFLPVGAVKKFCDSTDAIVECNLDLTKRLKDSHVHGGSLPAFCGATYDWFQKKYGQFCPTQCKKAQCQATCTWLAEKKNYGNRGKELESLLKDDMENQVVLAEEEAKLEDMKQEVMTLSIAKQSAETRKEQLENNLAEATVSYDTTKDEFDSLTGKSEKQKGDISDLNTQKSSLESSLQKDGFDRDFAVQARVKAEKEKDHVENKLNKQIGEETAMGVKREEAAEAESVLEVKVQDQSLARDGLAAEVQKQDEVVTKKKQQLTDAQDKLKAAVEDKEQPGYDAVVKDFKEMVTIEDDEYQSELDALRKEKLKLSALNLKLDQTEKEVQTAKDRVADIDKDLYSRQQYIDELQGKFTTAKEEYSAAQVKATKAEEKVKGTEDQLAENKKKLEKAELTLKFVSEALGEATAKLDKVTAQKDKAAAAVPAQDEVLKAAIVALSDKEGEYGVLSEKVQTVKDSLSEHNAQIEGYVSNYQEWGRALDYNKPEIVRQHGLSLLELLGH